jgi:hypothetical protein
MKKEILMSAEKILNKFAIKEVFTISEDASVEEALHAIKVCSVHMKL